MAGKRVPHHLCVCTTILVYYIMVVQLRMYSNHTSF